jgi:hypothetical protein
VKAQELIRQWAKEGGRKLGWLADQLPVAGTTMSRWMQGDTTPAAIYRNRLAEITGIDELRDEKAWQ